MCLNNGVWSSPLAAQDRDATQNSLNGRVGGLEREMPRPQILDQFLGSPIRVCLLRGPQQMVSFWFPFETKRRFQERSHLYAVVCRETTFM